MIEAIELIKTLNETGRRALPEGSPIDFIPDRWRKHLYNTDGTINRHYYEMATLTELRNKIRSGDVAVESSRNYKSFNEYIVSKDEWKLKCGFSELAVSDSFEEYMQERIEDEYKGV